MEYTKEAKQMEERTIQAVKKYLGRSGFTNKVVRDTPIDAFSLTNRKFVTANGTVRPTSSVVGSFFLDMTLASGRGKPIYWNGTGWIDATGTYV